MKKIRFIKENPLFDWKVGDVVKRSDYYMGRVGVTFVNAGHEFDYVHIQPKTLVKQGFAEWVEETADSKPQPDILDNWEEELGNALSEGLDYGTFIKEKPIHRFIQRLLEAKDTQMREAIEEAVDMAVEMKDTPQGIKDTLIQKFNCEEEKK